MTDRVNALIVVLDQPIREDDLQPTIDAIRQIKHVIAVEPHVEEIADLIARETVRQDLTQKLWNSLHPSHTPGG